jgi:hypothetical protein
MKYISGYVKYFECVGLRHYAYEVINVIYYGYSTLFKDIPDRVRDPLAYGGPVAEA